MIKIDDAQFSKITDAINEIYNLRVYDLGILYVALFGSQVSALAIICTVFIFKKQVQIMSQQSNTYLLKYSLKVFYTLNKVLIGLIYDKFKENFILSVLNKNAFSKRMEGYTSLRDKFTEEAYSSSILFEDDIASVLEAIS